MIYNTRLFLPELKPYWLTTSGMIFDVFKRNIRKWLYRSRLSIWPSLLKPSGKETIGGMKEAVSFTMISQRLQGHGRRRYPEARHPRLWWYCCLLHNYGHWLLMCHRWFSFVMMTKLLKILHFTFIKKVMVSLKMLRKESEQIKVSQLSCRCYGTQWLLFLLLGNLSSDHHISCFQSNTAEWSRRN